MMETWIEERGWEKLKYRLPAGWIWEVQYAKRTNKKGRAMGGMVMGIKKGIEVEEIKDMEEIEGMMGRMVKIGKIKWRMVGVYVKGDLGEKLEAWRSWREEVGSSAHILIGGEL